MRKIEINFTNRWLYSIALIIGIFALAVGVYAVVPNPGHTASEIEGVCLSDGTNCPAGTIDTRCDVSGTCSQVCIGTDCQTTWPGLKQYVGATSTAFNGDLGGYSGGDAKCVAQFGAGSRMAAAADFAGGTPTVAGWYSSFLNYPVQFNPDNSNLDCLGWESTAFTQYGPKWDSGNNRPSFTNCNTILPILCSK